MQKNKKIALLLSILLLTIAGVVVYFEFFYKKPDKYSCQLNQCVVDSNGIYDDEDSCNVNCLTREYICDLENKKCSTDIPSDHGDKPTYNNLGDCSTMCGWKVDGETCVFVNEAGVSKDESTCRDGLTYYYNPRTNKCGVTNQSGFEAAGTKEDCEDRRYLYLNPETNVCSKDNPVTDIGYPTPDECAKARRYFYNTITNNCIQGDRPTSATSLYNSSENCMQAEGKWFKSSGNECTTDIREKISDAYTYDSEDLCNVSLQFYPTTLTTGYPSCSKRPLTDEQEQNMGYDMDENCLDNRIFYGAPPDCKVYQTSNCDGATQCDSAEVSPCSANTNSDQTPDDTPSSSVALAATDSTDSDTCENKSDPICVSINAECSGDIVQTLANAIKKGSGPTILPPYKCDRKTGCMNSNRPYKSLKSAINDCIGGAGGGDAKCDRINFVKKDDQYLYYLRRNSVDQQVTTNDKDYKWGVGSVGLSCKSK